MVPIYYRGRVLRRGLVDTYRAFGWWTLIGAILCFFVGWALHYWIDKSFPWTRERLGDPMAQWWIGIIYIVAPMGAIALAMAAFNIFMAPSRIDAEKKREIGEKQWAIEERDKTIADLKADAIKVENRPSLVIDFDKKDEICVQDTENVALMLRIRVSLSPSTAETKKIEVTFRIEATKNKRAMKKKLKELQGGHLMGKHDQSMPAKHEFPIYPQQNIYFKVAKQITDPAQPWASDLFFICHAIAVRERTPEDKEVNVTGKRKLIRDPDDRVPRMPYILTITAIGEHVNSCVGKFRLAPDRKGRMTLRLIGVGGQKQDETPTLVHEHIQSKPSSVRVS
jgi:hypothetical protein